MESNEWTNEKKNCSFLIELSYFIASVVEFSNKMNLLVSLDAIMSNWSMYEARFRLV